MPKSLDQEGADLFHARLKRRLKGEHVADDPLDTSEWREEYNQHRDEQGQPGNSPTSSPGVNTVLQPNLNNSLIGRVRLEAVKRLLRGKP